MRMRVMHVAETLQGGVATYVDALVNKQVKESLVEDVCICAPLSQASFLSKNTERLIGTRNRSRGIVGFIVFVFDVIVAVFRFKPDVIHLHSTFAGLLCRLTLFPFFRNRIVYCSHGWAFLAERSGLANKIILWLERIFQHLCHAIINISEYEHRSAIDLGFSPNKMVLIPNGINKPLSWSGRVPRGFNGSQYNVAFVGRLDRQKGGDIFLEVAEHVLRKRKDVTFHVVGESVVSRGPKKLKTENIVFHGWVDHENVFDFFYCSDLLVMPSRWEGFGLVAAEAMACGCFVLSSDRGALPELVNDGYGNSINMDEFVSEAADFICSNVESISKNNFEPSGFTDKYSFAALSEATLDIYKGIV